MKTLFLPGHMRSYSLVARYYETRLAGLLRLAEALRGRVVFLAAAANEKTRC